MIALLDTVAMAFATCHVAIFDTAGYTGISALAKAAAASGSSSTLTTNSGLMCEETMEATRGSGWYSCSS